MLDLTLLLAFSLLQQPTGAVRIIDFGAPEPVPHHPDATVEFFCHTEGTPDWRINGTGRLSTLMDLEMNRGFTFISDTLDDTNSQQHKLNMTVEVAGNNNTNIRCVVIGTGGPGVNSTTVTIIVAGPPLPPSPILRVVNATDLQLRWEEPFTSEGFGIKQYNVSVRTSNETQSFEITDRVFDWSRDDIAQSCEELNFTVTATNDIGNSETANISWEFPVAPGPFISPVEGEVTFLNDGQPRIEVHFLPPQICRSQSSSFNITVQKLGENGNIETVYMEGPVGYTNGSGAEKLNFDIRSGLERNQMYLVTVHFSTVAGDSNSSATFNTRPSGTPIPDGPVLVCGAVGPPIVFNCDANNAAFRIECQYDSGPFFTCDLPLEVDPNLPPGPHNLTVVYTDVFEQTSEQTFLFNVADTRPSGTPIPDGPDRSDKTLVIIISAVIGVLGVVFLLGIVLIAAFTYLRRKAKRKERNESRLAGPSLDMVSNPIYEGPVYDIINDSTQLMTLSSETPPRVAPRRDRVDKNNRSMRPSENGAANGAIAASPEDTYTFMNPVGAAKGYGTQRSSTAKENRYVVGD